MGKVKYYKAIVSYDGTNYSGFQVQKNLKTVAGELILALQRIDPTIDNIAAASRTDAKVHALGQVILFSSSKTLKIIQWIRAINCYLPKDIQVKKVNRVTENFHPRFKVVSKEYLYIINTGEKDIFKRNFQFNFGKKLDMELLKKTANLFLGVHNFGNFTTDSLETKHTLVKNISNIDIQKKGKIIKIKVTGSGFLRYQVRFMVGAMIKVASNKSDLLVIKRKLENRQFDKWTFKAPAEGLYLMGVKYE